MAHDAFVTIKQGLHAGLARGLRISGAQGAGQADSCKKEKDRFFYIDHFYAIPKELSRYKKPSETRRWPPEVACRPTHVMACRAVALHVNAIHAAQAAHQRAIVFIAVGETGITGFFARFPRRQRIRARTDGTGETDGGTEDKYGFLEIDHFYPVSKQSSSL
ncbi:hypothetical protein [Janthinobacterium sp. 1_2014MBL_MicDiv]|uniref:hypothetical protein n=1 Tax=Janthinobacterium sp. 1_2014MBL_MicDiv TaxID=1644131 RepID=UPI0012EB784A|nr:hypothetical protein [Janthinobacterium sp. 1_2014MBL_MicDiv]